MAFYLQPTLRLLDGYYFDTLVMPLPPGACLSSFSSALSPDDPIAASPFSRGRPAAQHTDSPYLPFPPSASAY